jgi:hypothetical protein
MTLLLSLAGLSSVVLFTLVSVDTIRIVITAAIVLLSLLALILCMCWVLCEILLWMFRMAYRALAHLHQVGWRGTSPGLFFYHWRRFGFLYAFREDYLNSHHLLVHEDFSRYDECLMRARKYEASQQARSLFFAVYGALLRNRQVQCSRDVARLVAKEAWRLFKAS